MSIKKYTIGVALALGISTMTAKMHAMNWQGSYASVPSFIYRVPQAMPAGIIPYVFAGNYRYMPFINHNTLYYVPVPVRISHARLMPAFGQKTRPQEPLMLPVHRVSEVKDLSASPVLGTQPPSPLDSMVSPFGLKNIAEELLLVQEEALDKAALKEDTWKYLHGTHSGVREPFMMAVATGLAIHATLEVCKFIADKGYHHVRELLTEKEPSATPPAREKDALLTPEFVEKMKAVVDTIQDYIAEKNLLPQESKTIEQENKIIDKGVANVLEQRPFEHELYAL